MSLIIRPLPDGGCEVVSDDDGQSPKAIKPLFGKSNVVKKSVFREPEPPSRERSTKVVEKKKKKFVFREPKPPSSKPRRLFKVNHHTKTIKVRLPHATNTVLVFKPHVAKCPMVKMEDLIKRANGTISLWDEDSTGKLVEIRLGPDWKSTRNDKKTVEAEGRHQSAKKCTLSPCELLRAPKSQKRQSGETPRKEKVIDKPKVCPRKLELEKVLDVDDPCPPSDFLMATELDDFEICLFETGTVDDLLIGLNDKDFNQTPVQPVRVRSFRDAVPAAKLNKPVLSSDQRKFQKFIQGRSTR